MKVKELLEILSKFPKNAEIVIAKDIDEHGFAHLDQIIPGVFELTEYGNDFYPDQGILINKAQVRAVCLTACKADEPESIDLPAGQH